MNTYETYLRTKNYAPSSIKSYQIQVEKFMSWCRLHNQEPSTIDYKNCLVYLKYLSQKSISKRTINFILGCIKSYFTYLIKIEAREDNPLATTIIKGVVRTINHNLLDEDQLAVLYQEYPTNYPENSYQYYTAKRNKVIIGLMVYQGLDTSDIRLLKITSLRLEKGMLQVSFCRTDVAMSCHVLHFSKVVCFEPVCNH